MQSFEEGANTPHVLVELSKKELFRLAPNSISLKGVSSCKKSGKLLYETVKYGTNIRKRKSSITFNGNKIPSYEVSIQSMKTNSFIITLPKSDAMSIFPELVTSESTYNDDPSGTVLLMACVYQPDSNKGKKWNNDDFKEVKKCKPNILQSSKHHQSTGYYASFGNKGSYEIVNSSSVGQYTTKKHTKLSKQQIINSQATKYETYCANEIARSVCALKSFLPNIQSIIAPVLETSYELQLKEQDLNLKEMSSVNEGCWQTSICIDAETREYHTEHDCTYTLISIPSQESSNPSASSIKYDFLFKLTNNQTINISLKPGLSFMFSGLYLTHRQNKSQDTNNLHNTFFNMASYGNKRLFQHLRKTYNNNK